MKKRTKMSETKLLASSLQRKWNDTGTDMRTKGEMREGRGEEGKEGAGRFQLDCCSGKVGTWPSVWLRHVGEIFLGGESTQQVISYGAFCQDRLQRCPHSEL